MGLWGKKKKRRRKRSAPRLEPVQAMGTVMQPVPSAPTVQIADPNIKPQTVASIDPEAEKTVPDLDSGKYRKRSRKPLLNIQRKIDRINSEDTPSLEERYEKAFGERLPQNTRHVKEKKKDEDTITFKPKAKVSFKLKTEAKDVKEDKGEKKGIFGRLMGTVRAGGSKAGSILGSGTNMTKSAIGATGKKTKTMLGFAGSAIGSGAGMVKSGVTSGAGMVKTGVTSGASKVKGAVSDYRGGSPADYESMTVKELKTELKKRGLKVSGKKPDLIARLNA